MLENQYKRSIRDDISRLKGLMPWIGDQALDRLHIGSLQSWIAHRQDSGVSTGTINHGLQLVRRIVNVASAEWMDDNGLTWLQSPPKIKLLVNADKRQPYPLSWDEQAILLRELPDHLTEMALFAVNTGCREQEICNLRWQWEVEVPELATSVFIIPGDRVKNADARLVVLNRVAHSVIAARRATANGSPYVFTYDDRRPPG